MKEDVWIKTACDQCYVPCGVIAHRVDGVVVKIDGDPTSPQNFGKVCAKGQAAIMGLYNPNHIEKPLKRTNPKKGLGVDPKFVEISWDEAMDIIVEKLRKVREDDPKKVIMSTFDMSLIYEAMAWLVAFGGCPGVWMTAGFFCGAALHQYTYLTNASFHTFPDLEYCNYLILVGNGHGFGVGSKPNISSQCMADARMRGMKLVVIDPMCSHAAAKANEWLPIRPGTDGAMAMAMLNVLLNELGIYDREFLKMKTNAPYLIRPDGHYVRDKETKKPLVWDAAEDKAKTHDADVKDYVIEGEKKYIVDGVECKPAFQLLKEHVQEWTCEKASEITTIPAETIRRIAREYGEAARIGSTIVIDGEEFPYRPAANNQYRGAYTHKHGGQSALTWQLLNLIIGGLYAAGSHQGLNPVGPDNAWEPQEGPDGLMVAGSGVMLPPRMYEFLEWEEDKMPDSADLMPLFPATWSLTTQFHLALRNPEKYKIPQPEVLVHWRSNVMITGVDAVDTAEALKKISFQLSFALEIDETVEFADIVLPEPYYLEKSDIFIPTCYVAHSSDKGLWGWGIRQPVVKPRGERKEIYDIFYELSEKLGFREDYNMMLNVMLEAAGGRKPLPRLDPGKKYTREEFMDVGFKYLYGPDHGLAWFKQNGWLVKKRTLKEKYPLKFINLRVPIYFEHFLRAGEIARRVRGKLGIPLDDFDFQPLVGWKGCPAYENRNDPVYDLYVINYTSPFQQYSISPENPWLNEVSEMHPSVYKILINAETAARKRIEDGDTIEIESTNGNRSKAQVKVSQCIHPEVLGTGGALGSWCKGKPVAKGKGPLFNTLLPMDHDHIDDLSAAVDACVRVKIVNVIKKEKE